MKEPPYGYDDESIVPKKRLIQLVKQVEDDLTKIERVYRQHLPLETHVRPTCNKAFWNMRHSADELGPVYSAAVEKLITNYTHFLSSPSPEKLNSVHENVKELEMLLVSI